MRLELDLYFLWQIHALNLKFIFKDSSKTPENWLLAKGNNFQNFNFICIMLWQIHVPNFKSLSLEDGRYLSGKLNLSKGR